MARYLVTGGAGFIGSHLVDSLMADGHAVRVLDDLSSGSADNLPAPAELQVSEVTDPDAVGRAMEGVDGCFHLAAIASVERGHKEWLRSHTVNLSGTIAVFEAACLAPGSRTAAAGRLCLVGGGLRQPERDPDFRAVPDLPNERLWRRQARL